MIIPVYKPLGASTHQLAQKVGQLYKVKATHTGTLDPMAEGVVIVLTENDRFNKEKLSDVKKTYTFEVLIGFSTDSNDLLGKITDSAKSVLIDKKTISRIKAVFELIKSRKSQQLPNFSAKRYKGGSFFDLAKLNKALPVETSTITVHSLVLLDTYTFASQELQQVILQKLATVSGDFRQSEIIQIWNAHFKYIVSSHFTILKCQAVTSKRTYIRGIVRDLSLELGLPCTTFSITRVKNGEFGIENCIDLFSVSSEVV